jgi:hypothetical protein
MSCSTLRHSFMDEQSLAQLFKNSEISEHMKPVQTEIKRNIVPIETILEIATKNSCNRVIQFILTNYKIISHSSLFGVKLLHIAIPRCHIDIIKLIIYKFNVNTNCKRDDQATPLHNAAEQGKIDVVKYLLTCPDIDVNALDHWKNTALHLSCFRRQYIITAFLLQDKRVNDNITNDQTFTPFQICLQVDLPQMFLQLFDIYGRSKVIEESANIIANSLIAEEEEVKRFDKEKAKRLMEEAALDILLDNYKKKLEDAKHQLEIENMYIYDSYGEFDSVAAEQFLENRWTNLPAQIK